MAYKKTVYLVVLISIFLNTASFNAAQQGRKSLGKRLCTFFMGAAVATSRVNGFGVGQCDFTQQYDMRAITSCENAESHHVDAALQACGGCINDRSHGMSLLEDAVLVENMAVSVALLQKGAKTGLAFHKAILYHSDPTKFVRLLAENGGDINANENDMFNNTPLHLAASKGNVKVVELLLSFGANPLLLNFNSHLPSQMVWGWSSDSIKIQKLLAIAEKEFAEKIATIEKESTSNFFARMWKVLF